MVEAPRLLPGSLASFPRLDHWISIDRSGIFTLSPGKVEMGQGILTALAQIAAIELDILVSSIAFNPAKTGTSPNEGVTSGSLSIRDSGMAIRQVAAEVRHLFVAQAAKQWGKNPVELVVKNGLICGPKNLEISYGALSDSVSLAQEATGKVVLKSATERLNFSDQTQRIDIPGRVFGTRGFINDIKLPDLLHGCILRPPRPQAKLKSIDEKLFSQSFPDVEVYRNGSVIGVIASSEAEAKKAIAKLGSVTLWEGGTALPNQADLAAWLEAQPVETEVAESQGLAAPMPSTKRFTSDYLKPYLAHGSIATSCAIATWEGDQLHVISHSQGVYNLQTDLALVFGIKPESITVEHAENAGCYGHNGADDVALDAALLAQAFLGKPVRVTWSRADELTHSPFGAAMLVRVTADLELDGSISYWQHEIWSNGHTARPGRANTPALLASFDLAKPFPPLAASDPPLASGGGAQRNAVPAYQFQNRRVIKNRILNSPLRTSSMRSLGAIGNLFAIESFMDELAEKAEINPLAFRWRNLTDPRAKTVLERVAQMSNWQAPRPDAVGKGIAFARYKNTSGYCAVVAEVDVSSEPRATNLWIAADIGEVISEDGAINQIEGGAIQAVSWALKEEVLFSSDTLLSDSWENYPILRFNDVPKVEVALINRPDEAPLGAGEISLGPTAAAIANAIHNALGIRVKEMPFTRESVIKAMET